MLLKNEFVCDNVKIVRPILTHIEAIDRKDDAPSKKVSEEFDFPITIKNLSVIDADVDFRIKTKDVKEFEVFDLTIFVKYAPNDFARFFFFFKMS